MRQSVHIRSLWKHCGGAVGAEFAMVLPLFIVLFLGMIDVGRYMWQLNAIEKATQIGARMAVVTSLVPSDLFTVSYGTTLGQGAPIPTSSFGGITCTSTGSAVSCSCISNCTGLNLSNVDSAAFNRIADRMTQIAGAVHRSNVTIRYINSGLGYAGDPNGADVAPIVTVQATGVSFTPLIFEFFGGSLALPAQSASLTLEDGQGTTSN